MDIEDQERKFMLYTSWVNSLRVSLSTTLEPEALVNCRSFAEVLHRIDDQFFGEEWVEKITDFGPDSSWRLKGNNLTKVIRKVTDYIEENDSRSIKGHTAWNFDDQEFVELHSFKDLNKIFCLIVGCAFMGQNKQEFVNLIQQQPKDLQELVMTCVLFIHDNSVEHLPLATQPQVDVGDSSTVNGKTDANGNGRNNAKLIKELVLQVDDLKLDKERLEKELEVTKQELFEYTSNRSVEHLQAENDDLKKRKEQAEDRLLDMEARVETMSTTLETKEQELASLQDKLEQIHQFQEEYRKMRDEVGELKTKELELIRVSRELESLKQRSKHDSIDKTELNVLREKSAEYVKDMITLEDERIKTKTLRQQVASLKAQMEEKEGEVNRATIRMSKLESELAETKSRLATAEKKCDDVVHEKLQMQSRIRELEHLKDPINGLNSLSSELENVKADELADRSRVLDLQNEVDRLREHVRQLEPLELSQMEWRTTKEQNRELESEKQLFLQKQVEYKARIEALEMQLDAPKSNADVNQLRIQLEQQSIETKTLKERVELYERKMNDADDGKKRLETTISELNATIELRNSQLKKAKKLISDQEQKLSSSDDGGPTVHQFDVLRKDLDHKEKLVKHLQEQLEKSGTAHEEESRLVATSYHAMANEVSNNTGGKARTFMSKHLAVSPINVILPWSLVLLLLFVTGLLALPHWCREALRPPPLLV